MSDPKKCPACKGPNRCGTEEGKGTCWCFIVRIPEDLKSASPGDSCLCERCIENPNQALHLLEHNGPTSPTVRGS